VVTRSTTKCDGMCAFWDNELGAYVDATFHLFDEVQFYYKEATNRQRPLPFAYIKASEKLFGTRLWPIRLQTEGQ
jgi:hypothetical protein